MVLSGSIHVPAHLRAKHPKAVARIIDDLDRLLEVYRYWTEHWVPLRTTNPIESTFASAQLQQKLRNGLPLDDHRQAGAAMAFQLVSLPRPVPSLPVPSRPISNSQVMPGDQGVRDLASVPGHF